MSPDERVGRSNYVISRMARLWNAVRVDVHRAPTAAVAGNASLRRERE